MNSAEDGACLFVSILNGLSEASVKKIFEKFFRHLDLKQQLQLITYAMTARSTETQELMKELQTMGFDTK